MAHDTPAPEQGPSLEGGLPKAYLWCGAILVACAVAALFPAAPEGGRLVGRIPFEFFLFGMTLLGVALFHHFTLQVAVSGVVSILAYKLAYTDTNLVAHVQHEWVILANLLCLLLGFALLADHFERSKVPNLLPRFLPNGWTGGLVLLVLVFILSSFLDNIAGAMIGATIAKIVFKGRVHLGFLAAVVAASNAGGAGSVVGDTTTTMMWIAGVSPLEVLHAFVASAVALVVFGVIAAKQQHGHQPIQADPTAGVQADWGRVLIVAIVLVFAIAVNVTVNVQFSAQSDRFPFIGAAIALALLATAVIRKPDWSLLPAATKGACFLLSLVLCASLMPVNKLPAPSPGSALGLGFLSAVFDNIPLTALAIKQDHYDWGMLAYTVGFGGSMVWFGSSAGVAVSNLFPEAKSVGQWLRHGWHIAVAYVLGFVVLALTVGWHPTPTRANAAASSPHGAPVSPGTPVSPGIDEAPPPAGH